MAGFRAPCRIYFLAVYCYAVHECVGPTPEAVLFSREMKKGSGELLILSLLESRPRHGYELGKLIENRSGGRLRFRIASLYPMLCRLEARGLIAGRWLEKAGERRKRFFRLTPAGRRVLQEERALWKAFVSAVSRVAGVSRA